MYWGAIWDLNVKLNFTIIAKITEAPVSLFCHVDKEKYAS